MRWSHSSSSGCGRALSAGKLPTIPALHCAMTRSGPETMKSGEPMTGRRRRSKIAGRAMNHSRSEEHTSELQSLMRISYAVFCLKKKNNVHTYSDDTYVISYTRDELV